MVFIGKVDEHQLPALYASATAFAIASPFELQGITILEALASGLPIVGADAGAIPELVVPGISGERFHPGSAPHCVEACLEVLDRPERYGQGPRTTAGEHSLPAMVTKFESLLLGNGQRPDRSLACGRILRDV